MAQTYSIKVSGMREVLFAGRIVTTGIYKQPIHGEVSVGKLGVAGDAQADLTVHGGLDKGAIDEPVRDDEAEPSPQRSDSGRV